MGFLEDAQKFMQTRAPTQVEKRSLATVAEQEAFEAELKNEYENAIMSEIRRAIEAAIDRFGPEPETKELMRFIRSKLED